MKIAIITSGFLPVIDGVTVSGYSRLQKLSQWGHQVLLLCPDYSASEQMYPNWRLYTGEILPGVKVVNLESTAFMGVDFDRNPSFWSYRRVVQELQAFQPDIIHVDEAERLFVGFWRQPGVAFARRARIPCVAFFRTNFSEYVGDFFDLPPFLLRIAKSLIKAITLFAYNSYDLTLVSSQVTYEKILQMGITNAHYANLLGFDGDRFSPNLRQPHFFERHYGVLEVEQRIKLIYLGRLTPDKGWEFTLNALAQLAAKRVIDDLALIIVGGGPMEDEIATRLSQLTPHVHLLGRVPPEQVPALLANSDIHVTASEKETRGLTILEAFAAGIPVIAPRAGGVTENIQDGWNGYLFTPQDQDDFLEKLQHLLTNAGLRQEMGRNGRSCIAPYSWNQTVQNLVEVWQDQIDHNCKSR